MTQDPDALPATAHAVLGILEFGAELSGYDLRQWALHSLGHFYWSPAQSQIYAELRRLEALGYAEGRAVRQEGRPDKTLYRITAAGSDALSRWARDAAARPVVLKHHLILRLFLSGEVDPDVVVPLLEAHRDGLLSVLDDLENQSVAMGGDPAMVAAAAAVDWAAEIHRGDLRGVEAALKRVRPTY